MYAIDRAVSSHHHALCQVRETTALPLTSSYDAAALSRGASEGYLEYPGVRSSVRENAYDMHIEPALLPNLVLSSPFTPNGCTR